MYFQTSFRKQNWLMFAIGQYGDSICSLDRFKISEDHILH